MVDDGPFKLILASSVSKWLVKREWTFLFTQLLYRLPAGDGNQNLYLSESKYVIPYLYAIYNISS
jgi:hypothetical protein